MKSILVSIAVVACVGWFAAMLVIGIVGGITGPPDKRLAKSQAEYRFAVEHGIVDDIIRANAAANPCRPDWSGYGC